MINRMDRTLTIMADGEPVTGYARARLLGTEKLGLYPSLFMLHLWNVAEEDYLALSRSREVTVLHIELWVSIISCNENSPHCCGLPDD